MVDIDKFIKNDLFNGEFSGEVISYLNNYEGVLPKYLFLYVNSREYEDNLKKLGLYDKVYEEYYEIRLERLRCDDKRGYDFDELKNWLIDNPEFITLVNGE